MQKRQILGTGQKSEFQSLSSVTAKVSGSLTKSQIEKLLRQKRSSSYMKALHQLDAGGHMTRTEELNKFIETLKSELPEIIVTDFLVGIIAKCYLGHPFEVHTLKTIGNIIAHYKIGESLPDGLEKARAMAKHSSYACIEVYSSYIVAVAEDGSTSLIANEGENNNG